MWVTLSTTYSIDMSKSNNPFEAFFAPRRAAARPPANTPIVVEEVEVSQSSMGDDELLLGGLRGSSQTPLALPSSTPSARSILAVRDFPWSSKSSSERKEFIADVFHSSFSKRLRDDPAYSCFAPFVKHKYVDRYAEMNDVEIEPAPKLTHGDIACQSNCKLRDYQLQGVQFLLDSFHIGMSAILADDMGLGKTAQLCAFLGVLNTRYGIDGPHLIVVPLSTITGWVRELGRWAPGLKVHKYQGSKKSRSLEGARDAVIVTTPATLLSDRERLRGRTYVTMVVDEAHMLKNGSTQIVGLCSKMVACSRISLTGTPIQNSVREVWSQMSFLFPYVFDKRGDIDDDEAVEQCQKVLSVIMLRRTKGSMDLGIPPKVEEPTLMIEPTELQSTLLAALGASSDGVDNTAIGRLFMNLRKICNHPMTVALLADEQRDRVTTSGDFETTGLARLASAGVPITEEALVHTSAKMIKLELLLKELKDAGHRVLIFSNFTSQLDVLEGFCSLRGYAYERLDGSSNRVERELAMTRFNQPECTTFVFLISTTAGGVGVTLTGADTVILYDCHYNPQVDRQATDRAHRIGQKRPVHVYKMCLKGTAEEQIQRIAQAKAIIGDMVVDGVATSASAAKFFSIDDMRKLLRTTAASSHESESKYLPMLLAALDKPSDVATGQSNSNRRGVKSFEKRTNICFNCDEKMRPMEALVYCQSCPKGYHPDCLQEPGPFPRQWTCPRHFCRECEKPSQEDGALFYCVSCPSSFCLDCLHPDYMAIGDDGVNLRHVSRTYQGMEAEEMTPSRQTYYITCRACAGMEAESYN